MRTLPVLTVLIVAACAASACDESLSKLAGPSPNLEPTFSSIQSNIFESTDSAGRPACTNCHTSTGHPPAGGLNLTHDVAYDQLVNVASREKSGVLRVKAGDPDSSYLVNKVTGTAGIVGKRMPFSGPPFLTDGQIQILRRWIEIGAPKN